MEHDKVFAEFEHQTIHADGRSVYDFLGVATDVRFKRDWAKFASEKGKSFTPSLPPLNEHYFDWILTLESVLRASGSYRMAELGAGWGTWALRAAKAARQRAAITDVEVLAVEADQTHYDWLIKHFIDNGEDPHDHHLLHGAVAGESGTVRFPVIEDPSVDYGASMRAAKADIPYVEVAAYSLEDLLGRLDGPVDFLHVDIQGAEYEVLPPAMDLLRRRVKSIMIGTHISADHHAGMARAFRAAGWTERMNLARNAENETPYGRVQLGDGLLSYLNPDFI